MGREATWLCGLGRMEPKEVLRILDLHWEILQQHGTG